jgi:hypothetical protein
MKFTVKNAKHVGNTFAIHVKNQVYETDEEIAMKNMYKSLSEKEAVNFASLGKKALRTARRVFGALVPSAKSFDVQELHVAVLHLLFVMSLVWSIWQLTIQNNFRAMYLENRSLFSSS